jgi:PAS domain S-box-containing protein
MPSTPPHISVDMPAHLRSEFIDDFPAAIYRATLEGKIVFCSKAFAELLGLDPASDLTGYLMADFYYERKARGPFIEALLDEGYVQEYPILMKNEEGDPIGCAITARAVLDEDGIVTFVDGMIRNTASAMDESGSSPLFNEIISNIGAFVIILDSRGKVLDINKVGGKFMGLHFNHVVGKPLSEFVAPGYRNRFSLFLADVLKTGREATILTITDGSEKEYHLEFHALLEEREGEQPQIKGIARDVTEWIKYQRGQLTKKKFQGVMEMAGGVAHRLNQPLTIMNNLLSEIVADLDPKDRNYRKIMQMQEQTMKFNQIAKMIGAIKKYEAIDYVGGEKIVDIDKASLREEE